MYKIGERLLEQPKTCGDCFDICKLLNFQYQAGGPGSDMLFPNTKRLVEINNEVYELRKGNNNA